MNVLAVDTSSDHGSVAVSGDGEILGEVRLSSSVQHSERLFRSIDFLFSHVDIGLGDIDIFAAARGPGSFTGLRVGLAAMEGFAFANGRPAVGICTLAAMAWQSGVTEMPIAPMLDARRSEAYCALYERPKEQLVELRQPVVLKPADWFSTLGDSAVAFCGNGVFKDEFPPHKLRAWTVVPVDPYLSATIAQMAATPNGEELRPLYVRRPAAEARTNESSAP